MVMTLKEIKIEDAKNCIMCNGGWTKTTSREKYCESCKTHLLLIEDEVYFTQGW